MIEPNINMLYRLLFVYLIIHIAVFVYDVIKRITTYKTMNTKYYWKEVSITAFMLVFDIAICGAIVAAYVAKYILTGELL